MWVHNTAPGAIHLARARQWSLQGLIILSTDVSRGSPQSSLCCAGGVRDRAPSRSSGPSVLQTEAWTNIWYQMNSNDSPKCHLNAKYCPSLSICLNYPPSPSNYHLSTWAGGKTWWCGAAIDVQTRRFHVSLFPSSVTTSILIGDDSWSHTTLDWWVLSLQQPFLWHFCGNCKAPLGLQNLFGAPNLQNKLQYAVVLIRFADSISQQMSAIMGLRQIEGRIARGTKNCSCIKWSQNWPLENEWCSSFNLWKRHSALFPIQGSQSKSQSNNASWSETIQPMNQAILMLWIPTHLKTATKPLIL